LEDPDLVSRATAAFWEAQCPTYSEEKEPSSNPSANETGEAAADDMVVFEDLDHNATEMETITAVAGGQELGEAERLSNASLEHISKEIDEFYTLCEEMDVQPLPLEDGWIMDGSNFEVPSSPQPAPPGNLAYGSRSASFMAWRRSSQSCSDEAAAVPVIKEPQKLLKKVVAGGGGWANCGGGVGTSTTGTAQESGIKNHVMSERKRREKLNEMFLILKSLVPSIHKVLKKIYHQFFILLC
jgi:hypothetical protein